MAERERVSTGWIAGSPSCARSMDSKEEDVNMQDFACTERTLRHPLKSWRFIASHSAATRLCTSRKYAATKINTSPFAPNTIGAVNMGTSHPDSRFPIGIPPRKAQL